MKTVFMASDGIAIPAMEALKSSGLAELVGVVSNPDKPKGRGKKLSPNEVSMWALERGVALMRPEKSPAEDCVEWMGRLGVECIIVMAYGRILKPQIYEFPRLGCLNLHGSLLPQLRGASPVETSLALGDRETGVTLMKVVREMDAGDMAGKIMVPIGPRETGAGLRSKIAHASAQLLIEKLPEIAAGSLKFEPQDARGATYARKLSKADMMLDFNKSAEELDRRIRAFGGGLVPFGGGMLKIGEAFALEGNPHEKPGSILSVSSDGISIGCRTGVLKVTKLQAPCAKMLSVAEFLNGFRLEAGAVFESTENPPLLRP